jgi:hypothetical protein
VIIYICGTGYAPALRAFLTLFVQQDRITILFTTIALAGGIASLAASPLIGLTFSVGISLGGLGLALPFFVAAGLYLLVGVAVWSISPVARGNDDTLE